MVIVRFRHLSILSTPVPKSPHRSWTSATVSLKSSFGTNLFAVPYPSPSNPIRPKTPRINPAFRFIASDATVDIYINSLLPIQCQYPDGMTIFFLVPASNGEVESYRRYGVEEFGKVRVCKGLRDGLMMIIYALYITGDNRKLIKRIGLKLVHLLYGAERWYTPRGGFLSRKTTGAVAR